MEDRAKSWRRSNSEDRSTLIAIGGLALVLALLLATNLYAQVAEPPGDNIARATTRNAEGAAKKERAKTQTPNLNRADRQPAASTEPETLYQKSGNSLLKASLNRGTGKGLTLQQASWTSIPKPEPRTIKKHDLVTIIIREQSSFSSEGDTSSDKSTAIQAGVTEWISLNLDKIFLQGGGVGPNPASVNATSSRNHEGSGSVERDDNFTARITAEVIDVKPNRTLVLQARKSIATDDEEQRFTLTGICRAQDITPDNTVLSTQLYDMRLSKKHKGQVYDATKRGWIYRTVDQVDPF